MKILLITYSVLILGNSVLPLSIPILSSVQDVLNLAHDISDLSSGRVPFSTTLGMDILDPTTRKLNGLSQEISELTDMINVRMDKLMVAVMQNVPKTVQFNNIMGKLIEYTTRIDNLYDNYIVYVRNPQVNRITIEDFTKVVTSHKYGDVQDVLKRLYYLIAPGQLAQENQSLFELMVFMLMDGEKSNRCNYMKPPQQQLLDLYEVVMLSEVKGFIMTAYSYGVMSIYYNSSFTIELDQAVAQVALRSENYMSFTVDTLKKLSRELFLCDPPEHILGKTYVKMTPFHGIVAHETMLEPDGSCNGDCIEQDTTKLNEYSHDGKTWFPQNPCAGRMNECGDIGEFVTFCEMPKGSEISYSWVEIDKGVYGNKDNCDNGTTHTLLKYTSNIWNKCSNCYCLCSEEYAESPAIRTFSLRPQIADIDNNMIVTSARFEEKDKLIHIQIEESKMLSGGRIDESSSRLKELEDFIYLQEGSRGGWALKNGDETVTLEDEKDYSFVYDGHRDLYMDEVISLENGYVVTGLRLAKDPDNPKAVQLEVHLTPFNFSTGKLVPTDENPSKWITHKDMPGRDSPREEKNVTNLDPPNLYGYANVPDFRSNSEVWFVPTNRGNSEGINTIPYIDRQLIAPQPRLPLDGVSLYHRDTENSGGFFAIKLNTIDFSLNMKSKMSPEDEKIYHQEDVIETVYPQKME